MEKKYLTLACTLLALSACGDDQAPEENPGDSKVDVIIQTEVQTKATVVTALDDGSEMNLYAKTYGDVAAPDFVEGIKAVRENGVWSMTPAVRLAQGEKTFLYAVSPYAAANTNPAAVAIDIARQQDVLYSGTYVPVTYTTHTANLVMKHALSLVSFNVSQYSYDGKGLLQTLEVAGEGIYVKGTMNISTGKITGSETGVLSISADKQIQPDGWTDNLPQTWSIPFTNKTEKVRFKATIDGKTYETVFPEIEMKNGYQYIFHMVLTSHGLAFVPNQTETIPLNQENDEMKPLELYGLLQIDGRGATTFTAPRFLGDNIFGNITWGDNTTDSYAIGLQHEYTSGTWQCVFETWNSTGFELDDIAGIEVIDISRY